MALCGSKEREQYTHFHQTLALRADTEGTNSSRTTSDARAPPAPRANMLVRLLLVLSFCAASSHALVVGTAAAASTARSPAITMNDPFRKLGNVPAPALAATVGGAGLVVAVRVGASNHRLEPP